MSKLKANSTALSKMIKKVKSHQFRTPSVWLPLLQASPQSDMKIFNSECTQRVRLSKTNR